MSDPVLALYQHMMKNDIHLQYMGDLEEYESNAAYSEAACKRLQAMLDAPAKKELDMFLDMKIVADSIELEAVFTAGLAMGLQLLRLI